MCAEEKNRTKKDRFEDPPERLIGIGERARLGRCHRRPRRWHCGVIPNRMVRLPGPEFGAGARRTAPEAGALPIFFDCIVPLKRASIAPSNILVGFCIRLRHKQSFKPTDNAMTACLASTTTRRFGYIPRLRSLQGQQGRARHSVRAADSICSPSGAHGVTRPTLTYMEISLSRTSDRPKSSEHLKL